jgi:hypothetical protein
MDFFLLALIPLLRASIYTCILSLLKTSLVLLQDGVRARGPSNVVCNPEEPHAPSTSQICLLLLFLLADTCLRLAKGIRPMESLTVTAGGQIYSSVRSYSALG